MYRLVSCQAGERLKARSLFAKHRALRRRRVPDLFGARLFCLRNNLVANWSSQAMTLSIRPCERISDPRPSGFDRAPVTPSMPAPQPADKDMGVPGHNQEQRLDEALEETMPGSDPISVHIEEPDEHVLR
jgi:hypothetical protein